MAPRSIRVLVVDDSPFARRAISRVLAGDPRIKLVGEAGDGREGVALAERTSPDVVLLDLGMPVMDGISALRALRGRCPSAAVVVVSAWAQKGAALTLQALEEGAFDFVDKAVVSAMRVHDLADEILEKVRAAAAARAAPPPTPGVARPVEVRAPPEILVVGASTGGPQALMRLFERLPRAFPAPVVVVQHIPGSFIGPLAERIGELAELEVRVAGPAERLERGTVYFPAPGRDAEPTRRGEGLVLSRRNAAPASAHVPSIDVLFHGAARACGERAWAVLLTGMGQDGAAGLFAVREAGGLTIAQDEATCAVYGMPRAAVERGAASAVLPLDAISRFLTEVAAASVTLAPPPGSHP